MVDEPGAGPVRTPVRWPLVAARGILPLWLHAATEKPRVDSDRKTWATSTMGFPGSSSEPRDNHRYDSSNSDEQQERKSGRKTNSCIEHTPSQARPLLSILHAALGCAAGLADGSRPTTSTLASKWLRNPGWDRDEGDICICWIRLLASGLATTTHSHSRRRVGVMTGTKATRRSKCKVRFPALR